MSDAGRHAEEWSTDSAEPAELPDFHADGREEVIAADWDEPERLRAPVLERVFVALIFLASAAWIAASVYLAWLAHPDGRFDPAEVAKGIALASAPLALLALLFLVVQRSSGRAARRFGATAAAMRAEARSLDATMAAISARIEENRQALTAQAEQLLALGEESASRLAVAAESLRADTAALGKQSKALEGAAAAAKTDMAVLAADMPRVEADARAMAATLKEAGLGAHEQGSALAALLVTLAGRAQEAEENAGGAAQRLAAHIARIEGSSEVAGRSVEDVAAKLTGAVETALAASADGLDRARQGIDVQNAAMDAMVEQAQAALDRAGGDSTAAMALRIEEMSGQIDKLAARLTGYDADSRGMLANFGKGVAEVEARFVAVDDTVAARTANLAASVGNLSSYAERMTLNLNSGNLAADALIQRAGSLRTVLDICFNELSETLPQALTRLEALGTSNRDTIAAAIPEMARVEDGARLVADRLGEAEASVTRQRGEIDAMVTAIDDRIEAIARRAASLGDAIASASDNATRLSEAAGPNLIEALLRVRETATQAADSAREALAEVIPASAVAIGEASGAAIRNAVSEQVTAQIGLIGQVAEDALGAATRASGKLMQQMMTIADTSAAVKARIADAHDEIDSANRESFSQRSALLVESLNSTAIDVARILSSDVSDDAWAAYLKSDRGVFTRRAARLVTRSEAKAIARHYERDPDFRSRVNHYVHDFEAMLRPVLASRDGTALGVTLLSSDMGKIYVALAQGIARLRT